MPEFFKVYIVGFRLFVTAKI